MYEKLKESEIEFMEYFYNPIALKEVLFPENIKSPHIWLDDDYQPVKLRAYQYAWQNYMHMYAPDNRLKPEENFEKIKNSGICFNIGARNTGKSWDFIQLDAIINIIYGAGRETCCGSATQSFLTKVLKPVLNLASNHPFFEIFKQSGKSEGIRAGNDISIDTKHGHVFYGKNEKIESLEPGTAFHGLHYDILQYEETHYMSEKGEEKRIDSGCSTGWIPRFSGIPDIRIGSPLGKILSKEENQKLICRLPQSVREDWTEETKKARIEEYNGESSLAFKLNCLGEIIIGAEGYWDLERIKKKCLNKDRKIKQFDIDKKRFENFREHIILTRLPAEQIYCCADIGMGGRPTEIIIIFYNGKKYRVEYNITLNKLTAREQAKIFAYIYKKMGSCFIGVDCTTDYGILDYLEKDFKIPKIHLYPVKLTKNIDIAFEKNEYGRMVRDRQGQLIIKKMVAIDHAMNQLEYLFYEGLMDLPVCNKFWKEFSSFLVISSGLRNTYDTSSTDDLHQSYQVFAIVRWEYEFQTLINKNNKNISSDDCLGYI